MVQYALMNRKWWLLFFILILSSILRLYQLGNVPISLEWDEVAIGYDAFSILKTGRDQFGQLLPLTFRSLDDYKPPIYEYTAIFPIFLFGLNSFAVRLPSAIFGILSVLSVFWLGTLIFPKSTFTKSSSNRLSL